MVVSDDESVSTEESSNIYYSKMRSSLSRPSISLEEFSDILIQSGAFLDDKIEPLSATAPEEGDDNMGFSFYEEDFGFDYESLLRMSLLSST
jgi:hypothetical protein